MLFRSDEVLSVGDEKFRVRSYNRIKELITDKRRTVVIVSHDMHILEELCDSILWLHEGEIKQIGDPKEVLDEYKKFMR